MRIIDQDGISIEIGGRVSLDVKAPDEDVLSEPIYEYSGIPLGPDAPRVTARSFKPNLPPDGRYDEEFSVDTIHTRRDLFEFLAVLTPGVIQVWPPRFAKKNTVVEVDSAARPIGETAAELKEMMSNALDPELAKGHAPERKF